MGIQDAPHSANPHIVGNVGAMLATHLMAFLLRKGSLTVEDVAEIFQETRERYTSIQVPPDQTGEWGREANAILTLLEGDVVQFASQPSFDGRT